MNCTFSTITLCAIIGLTACAPSNAPKRTNLFSHGGNIDEIHLFGSPMALDLDNVPGSDAVAINIYASSSRYAHGLKIRSGTLEIVMFDGSAASITDDPKAKPRHVWSLAPEVLAKDETATSLGVGYRLALSWGTDRPEKKSVTLIARYLPPSGAPMYSSPSTISLVVK